MMDDQISTDEFPTALRLLASVEHGRGRSVVTELLDQAADHLEKQAGEIHNLRESVKELTRAIERKRASE